MFSILEPNSYMLFLNIDYLNSSLKCHLAQKEFFLTSPFNIWIQNKNIIYIYIKYIQSHTQVYSIPSHLMTHSQNHRGIYINKKMLERNKIIHVSLFLITDSSNPATSKNNNNNRKELYSLFLLTLQLKALITHTQKLNCAKLLLDSLFSFICLFCF